MGKTGQQRACHAATPNLNSGMWSDKHGPSQLFSLSVSERSLLSGMEKDGKKNTIHGNRSLGSLHFAAWI